MDRPECRVYTLYLRVPHEDGSTDTGWDGDYSEYKVHCALLMTPQWTNHLLPRIHDLCFVAGHLAGLYRLNDLWSLLINAIDITIITPSWPPDEPPTPVGDDAPGDNISPEDSSGDSE